MGMDANVVGFGPYMKVISEWLNYPSEEYAYLKDGIDITNTFFNCNTTWESRQLARILKVDTHDWTTHKINKEIRPNLRLELDMDEFYELCKHSADIDNESMVAFLACYDVGWTFFYRPNY